MLDREREGDKFAYERLKTYIGQIKITTKSLLGKDYSEQSQLEKDYIGMFSREEYSEICQNQITVISLQEKDYSEMFARERVHTVRSFLEKDYGEKFPRERLQL